ncbi:MAG: metallophosphoesterase family protein [Anaerolineales bacterium]|nr:metallophosphoesterase family protein [Anaerolineales bacterium]
MRYALISDIHGNATALEAVLADIERQTVDGTICLGDVATLGPQPIAVLERLMQLRCPCILGNHDEALLNPSKAEALNIPPHLHSSLDWGRQQLTPEHFDFLHTFTPTHAVTLSSAVELLCFHGSPLSNIDLILAETPTAELDRMLAWQSAAIFAGGHTHFQLLRQHRGQLVINPGSVGNVFLTPSLEANRPTLLPWAEYALVSWAEGVASVNLRRVPFDVAAHLRVIQQTDLPLNGWLREQYTRSLR